MRLTLNALAALAIVAPLATPLAAQQKDKDPTTSVAAAPMPDGWAERLDDKDATKSVKFITMGKGFHVTSGGAGIYYTAKDVEPNSPYSLMANFRQTAKITEHGDNGEAFGLFFGGHDLADADKETYYYFLVRQNGMFLINHRAGKEVHKLVDWTANPAIHKFDDMPNASNDLSVKIDADSVHFMANNVQVHAIPRSAVSDVSGQVGFRVNHNLDVHVSNYMAMKGM
jgi:hypothetical protein